MTKYCKPELDPNNWDTVLIPANLVASLEYGERDGLTDEEITLCNKFDAENTIMSWNTDKDAMFTRYHEFQALGAADCIECTVYRKKQ